MFRKNEEKLDVQKNDRKKMFNAKLEATTRFLDLGDDFHDLNLKQKVCVLIASHYVSFWPE